MPEFCQYLNCHNLASMSFGGFCNEDHMRRGPEMNFLREIVFSHKDIKTIKEARDHKLTSFSGKDVPTSFSHCEECKALLRESTAYQAK
jgi:hypothetical protein